jgi:predicted NBD/HSP70 family sugar kinase
MNRRLILNHIRERGPVPRNELAGLTGLSAPSVTAVVAELMAESLVVERESVASGNGSAGRRPIPIDINYDAKVAIGFKLHGDRMECLITDLTTTVIASFDAPLPDTHVETVIAVMKDAIPRLLTMSSRRDDEIMGVGVAMPGEIDVANGICIRGPRLGWIDVPFSDRLSKAVGHPVWIDEDSYAFGISQKLFGEGRNRKNFAAIGIGFGIGGAFIIDGKIYHGSGYSAAKFGHVTTVPDGNLCECGRRGCLMAHASEPYMLSEWQRRTGRSAMREDFAAAIGSQDDTALSIIDEAGTRIGRHLADLVNLIDPEIIVVGGEAIVYGDKLLDPIRASMRKYLYYREPTIVPDTVEAPWARGAAALVTQSLFDFERLPSGER